jgi:hypothetical protein
MQHIVSTPIPVAEKEINKMPWQIGRELTQIYISIEHRSQKQVNELIVDRFLCEQLVIITNELKL